MSAGTNVCRVFTRHSSVFRRARGWLASGSFLRWKSRGLIQAFEFTHELAWNVLKDYLESQGIQGVVGSKGATREAFKNSLIADGEVWMDMIKSRNQTSHTYNEETANEITEAILTRYCAQFSQFSTRFSRLQEAGS
jgi:nucleotidyltransferase substrate binding protein (TIGR01987 family)